MKKKYLICIFAYATVIVSGCATPHSFYSPIPQAKRADIQSIAVVPASNPATAHYYLRYPNGRPPQTRDGGSAGALAEGTYTAGMASAAAGPAGLLLFPLFLVAGTAGSAAASGAPPAEQQAPDLAVIINRSLADLELQKAISGHFLDKGMRQTPYRFVIQGGSDSISQEANSSYRSLRDQGFDIIVEIGVEKVGFNLAKEKDPMISFFMECRVRAVDPSDNSEIY